MTRAATDACGGIDTGRVAKCSRYVLNCGIMSNDTSTIAQNMRLKARAAPSNAASRFEPLAREFVDDGWDMAEDEILSRTEVSEERPRSVLSRNNSPDVGFDRSINPYRGCEHGCIYCFARPTHAYLGLSPGLDFETKLIARPGAAEVLRKELSRRGYQPAPIAIGTNTDPYQPIEKRYQVMRSILAVLAEFQHPVTIVTKGAMIERDIDLIGEMAVQGLVQVGISVTTLDPGLSRSMETARAGAKATAGRDQPVVARGHSGACDGCAGDPGADRSRVGRHHQGRRGCGCARGKLDHVALTAGGFDPFPGMDGRQHSRPGGQGDGAGSRDA